MKKKAGNVMNGEIYYYDFGTNEGSIQSGLRPVLVVQCNEGNKVSTTTVVAAITTAIKKQYLPSHVILGEAFGLKKPSMVMLEQFRTVNQCDLQQYIGFVDDEEAARHIAVGLKKALGLWACKPREQADIRCLCSRCLDDYKAAPDYIVRRLDPFAREKHRCDKCLGFGYEYIIIDTRKSRCGRRSDV